MKKDSEVKLADRKDLNAGFSQMQADRNKSTDHLTDGERFIWNWQRGRASDFYRALVKLMLRADSEKMERIRLGFPEEVDAYNQYRLVPGWWQELEARMEQ